MIEEDPKIGPDDVTPSHIRRYLIKRGNDGISTHTVNNCYRNPKIFWTLIVREELTNNNPYLKVDPPKRDKVMKPDLSQEEVQRLFSVCQGMSRLVWNSTDDISGRDDIEVFSVEMDAYEIDDDMCDYFESMRTE